MRVLKNVIGTVDVVQTNDKVYPFGLRVEGVVVLQSFSRELIETIASDPVLRERAAMAAFDEE